MVEYNKKLYKDIGLQREVEDALPYAVVGGAFYGSFTAVVSSTSYYVALNHIVPAVHQLKILFLRVWTQEDGGCKFGIYQTNPTATGATGTTEAYPVVGNTPSGYRDYPMLPDEGETVLRGSLVDPVHVCEGSIEFRIMGPTPTPLTGAKYGVTWWGVEKLPEPTRRRP